MGFGAKHPFKKHTFLYAEYQAEYFSAHLGQHVWMIAMCHEVYTDWLRLTLRRTKRKPQMHNQKGYGLC